MIQLLFFLRFRSQLHHIRPELISLLEQSIIESIEATGGKRVNNRWIIVASFDEDSLGIWLNIITVLERILAVLNEVVPELSGYSLVLGRDIPDYDMVRLCRALASQSGGAGIWCAPSVQKPLSHYMAFAPLESAGRGKTFKDNTLIEGYVQLKHLILPSKKEGMDAFPFREKIQRSITYDISKNAVLIGPRFMGKRDGLYHVCASFLGELPSLVLRFGSGGLGYLADVLSPSIRSFISGHILEEGLAELDTLGGFIFRERLRDEYPDYVLQKGRLFFQKVLAAYIAAVKEQKKIPILILENIHLADEATIRISMEVFAAIEDKTGLLIYGTCFDGAGVEAKASFIEVRRKPWETMFHRFISFSAEVFPVPQNVEMPLDLWEIAYTISLLGRYFPGTLFPQLFEEEAVNPAMIFRAFTMLSNWGVIDCTDDPVPRIADFTVKAEAILGARKEKSRLIVRNRLLAWISTGQLRPCFRLLEALVDLGGTMSDELVLNTIYGDVINGTYAGIEAAIKENRFDAVVGDTRGPALSVLFTTLKALIHGDETQIRSIFSAPMDEVQYSSGYKVQMLVNFAAYHLGTGAIETALETVKKAILLGQGQRSGAVAQGYRLFSLVNLSKQRIDEALDYIAFAFEIAEGSEHFDELGVTAYYAAAAQFLYGNLSKAERLAQQSEQTAATAGRPDWADRARFLRGKIRFDTGYYQEALDIFKDLHAHPTGTPSEDMKSSVAAWIYRARVFAGLPLIQEPSSPGEEALLFAAEASYLTGNYQKTAGLTEKLLQLPQGEHFLYTEQPDWRNGFAQCELLLLHPGALWNPMISAYRTLALCRLPSARAEREQAIADMRQLLRDELIPDLDPNGIFYFYAYYRVLQDSGADQIDMNSAISMAFKRLQRRAIHIDDPKTRQVYLTRQRWNGALMTTAKEYNLI
ncbi:MAG: hypothetical protein LBT13_07020 [Treponema sp.]|jgi:tetratricopeptide (TPR) repeat protein|nr:hypothetical protein [Treponema sp.]